MWNCHLITNCISEQLLQQCCVAVHPKFQWLTTTITYFSCSHVSGLAGTALFQAKGKLGLAAGFWSDSVVLNMSHCPAQWLPGVTTGVLLMVTTGVQEANQTVKTCLRFRVLSHLLAFHWPKQVIWQSTTSMEQELHLPRFIGSVRMTKMFSETLRTFYLMSHWLRWCHILIPKPDTGKST